MWNHATEIIRGATREILGIGKRCSRCKREAWWWNSGIQERVQAKQLAYVKLLDTKIEGEQKTNKMPYKIAKEEAKKAVTEAKNKAFGDMYEELDTKEGEKVLFRLDNTRERSSKDLNQVRSIKDEEGQVLVEETDIKLRWQRYFDKLLNEAREGEIVLGDLEHSEGLENTSFATPYLLKR
ncbi:uncharacterized protein LOC109827705 [Asparagus officinalis]|uniref:uncharacterized protein LOC109827705 n=1 Tax=Asparagus officinalis TaxID=4686 RepID=UPI00098DFBF5|nr:uncharacterized protein LOC109827705 [Asparagus officinalis]